MIYIVLGLVAVCAAVVLISVGQAKRIKRYREENAALHAEIRDAAARLERLREYTARNKSIEEAANGERRELNATTDGALVSRANALFGGVRDGQGGDNGGD
jgi:hypothetical protein